MKICRVRQGDRDEHRIQVIGSRIGISTALAPKSCAINVYTAKAWREGLLRPWPQESMADEFDDFVRAVAENDVLSGKPELVGNSAAQCPSAAVGMKVAVVPALRALPPAPSAKVRAVSVEASFYDLAGCRPISRASSSTGLPGS